jgi:SAM-dependent methyltransferase
LERRRQPSIEIWISLRGGFTVTEKRRHFLSSDQRAACLSFLMTGYRESNNGNFATIYRMESDYAGSHWDRMYEQGLPSQNPDAFFVTAFDSFVTSSFPLGGNALDVAGGLGRHGLFLAQRKWKVTTVDISKVAIRTLGQKAQQLGVTLDMFALDAKDYLFASDQFDLIVMFYHFDRELTSKVLSSLKPGGILICKSYVMWTSYEGTVPRDLQPLKKGELVSMLPGLQVLHHRERPVRDRGVVEYVGRMVLDDE